MGIIIVEPEEKGVFFQSFSVYLKPFRSQDAYFHCPPIYRKAAPFFRFEETVIIELETLIKAKLVVKDIRRDKRSGNISVLLQDLGQGEVCFRKPVDVIIPYSVMKRVFTGKDATVGGKGYWLDTKSFFKEDSFFSYRINKGGFYFLITIAGKMISPGSIHGDYQYIGAGSKTEGENYPD